MRLRRRAPQPPQALTSAALATPGERLLAATRLTGTDTWLMATSAGLVAVAPDAQPTGRRAWHEVGTAAWDRDKSVLTVTWADRSPPARWRLDGEPTFLAVVRERVQASVVLVEEVALPGRRRARVVLRQNLSSGELLEQVIGGEASGEPAESRAIRDALTRLREQAGMAPPPP